MGFGFSGALPGGEQGGEPGGVYVPNGTLHALPVGEGGGELPALGLTSGVAGGITGLGGVLGLARMPGLQVVLKFRFWFWIYGLLCWFGGHWFRLRYSTG